MHANSLARIAGLVGEAGRIRMLAVLLDGNGHPASDLAMAAGVSQQTASSHLAKLLSGGLIVSKREGRHRIFGLASADVAAAIEALGALAQADEKPPMPELRFARTCYDHLAGVLAIALRDELLKREALRLRKDAFILTPSGDAFLRRLDIDAESLRGLRRACTRRCLDWTERQHHVGGSLGAAFLSRFIALKWLARVRGTRAVRLTHDGESGFERVFGIRCAALRSQRAILPYTASRS